MMTRGRNRSARKALEFLKVAVAELVDRIETMLLLEPSAGADMNCVKRSGS